MPTFQEVMTLTSTVSGIAALQDVEAQALYNACCEIPKGGTIIETGCQLGRSSSLISQMAYAIGFDDIHIDPYTDQHGWMKEWMEMMFKLGGNETHAFTLLCMRTEQAAGILSKIGQIDVAYVDGDHEKEAALIDLRLVADKVRAGGLLLVHDYDPVNYPDYSFAGVVEAMKVYLSSGNWDEVGVYNNMGVWRRK